MAYCSVCRGEHVRGSHKGKLWGIRSVPRKAAGEILPECQYCTRPIPRGGNADCIAGGSYATGACRPYRLAKKQGTWARRRK